VKTAATCKTEEEAEEYFDYTLEEELQAKVDRVMIEKRDVFNKSAINNLTGNNKYPALFQLRVDQPDSVKKKLEEAGRLIRQVGGTSKKRQLFLTDEGEKENKKEQWHCNSCNTDNYMEKKVSWSTCAALH
jgi:hypothetical protein